MSVHASHASPPVKARTNVNAAKYVPVMIVAGLSMIVEGPNIHPQGMYCVRCKRKTTNNNAVS